MDREYWYQVSWTDFRRGQAIQKQPMSPRGGLTIPEVEGKAQLSPKGAKSGPNKMTVSLQRVPMSQSLVSATSLWWESKVLQKVDGAFSLFRKAKV